MGDNLAGASNALRDHLKGVRNTTARAFLFRNGYNSSSFTLPEFFDASGFSKIQLEPLDWTKSGVGVKNLKPSSCIELVTPKGEVGWRRFSLLHPYAYWHIVTSYTDSTAWPTLRKRLATPNDVASYTIPHFSLRENKLQGDAIRTWLKFAETDLIADSATYSHLGITDIQNFYPSIYTHSLAWAVDTRDVIKENRRDCVNFIGNRIDRLFQSAHATQTNGIPIGTMVSDIAAELVLTAVDVFCSDRLQKRDVIMARYRDDYRILAKSHHVAREAVNEIGVVLRNHFDLHLNASKTKILSDIIQGSLRPWARLAAESLDIKRVLEPKEKINGRDIKSALLAIHSLQQAHPGAAAALSRLSAINQTIETSEPKIEIRNDELRSCMAILRTFMRLREDTVPQAVVLADHLLGHTGDKLAREMIEEMVTEEPTFAGRDFLEVWLYRLVCHRFPDIGTTLLSKTTNPLLRMVRMERPHVEEFSTMSELSADDKRELEKFNFVNVKKLTRTMGVPLTTGTITPWRSRYL
jgi:reverse transcriptase-like protein